MAKRGRPPKSLGTKLSTLYVYGNEDTFTVNVAEQAPERWLAKAS